MRFLTAYFASQPWRSGRLAGTPRMRKRPIGELVEALRLCGADIDYYASEGYPPLWIEGRHLKADAPLRMRGNVSSQYVSAMMMVAPMMKGRLTIEIAGDCRGVDNRHRGKALLAQLADRGERLVGGKLLV